MGLPMDDIHAPTVASGPTWGSGASNGVQKDKLSLMELIAEKDRVQAELEALGSVLESHGVNMNTPLTTFDGYPRADLDIAQIRTTRARIIHLKNDWKDLMARIEVGLHAHHAAQAATEATVNPTDQARSTSGRSPATQALVGSEDQTTDIIETPFAKVNSVVPESPAHSAGLQAGDRIRRFGPVIWMNHEKLSKVAETVQRNEGRPILVKVQRATSDGNEEVRLTLTPRRHWGGRGMLGCHLVPL